MTQASPPMAMKTIDPIRLYMRARTADWLPVIGSMSPPKEKPMSVSRNEPATSSAGEERGERVGEGGADEELLAHEPGEAPRRRSGASAPCSDHRRQADGQRDGDDRRARAPGPSCSRTAARGRTAARCAPARGRSRATCCSPNWAMQLLERHLRSADQCRDRRPQLRGVAQQLVEHPRPADDQTTAIARIFGMKESVCSWICVTAWKIETMQADDEADEQQRERDLEGELHRLGRRG